MAPFRYDGPTVTLVVNPSAGRGKARRVLPKVTSRLLTGMPDAHLIVHQSASFSEARLRCIQAVDAARPASHGEHGDTLVVMGGDGMAHLGINACATTDVALGVIPAGTGDDFCRGTGLSTSIQGATDAIVAGRRRRIDVSEVTGRLAGGAERRYVGSIVSTGYDARVNRRTNGVTLPIGPLAYAYVALAELATFEPLRYRLEIDGDVRDIPAMFVAIGNAGFFGGGMHICPRAVVDDGLLDVTIIHPVSRATLLRLLPLMFSGRFQHDPAVEQIRARHVRVDGRGLFGMADGEELGQVPLDVRCVPQSLTLLG